MDITRLPEDAEDSAGVVQSNLEMLVVGKSYVIAAEFDPRPEEAAQQGAAAAGAAPRR